MTHQNPHGLDPQGARQLANTTKTPPLWGGVTPRWLVSLLQWTPVEAGVYRVNRVGEDPGAGRRRQHRVRHRGQVRGHPARGRSTTRSTRANTRSAP